MRNRAIRCGMKTALEGRVAIITGATAGIGHAIAQDFVAHGAKVVINARRADRLAEVCAEFNKDQPAAAAASVCGDCADQAVIDQMLNTAKRSFGRDADLIVVNAGRGLNGSVVTSDITQWEEMLRTNVLAAAYLMRAAARRLLSQVPEGQTGASGSWLNAARDMIVIGSVVGRHVSPFSSMYGGTKYAVHGMVEGVRRELGPKGVRVTLVEPAFVESEFQAVAGYERPWFESVKEKIGPVLQPMDVARCVTFIAQQPAAVHVSDVLVRPTRQDYP